MTRGAATHGKGGGSGQHRVAARGSLIFHAGDVSDCAFIVERGAVEIHARRHDGRTAIVQRLGPGDLFGESALLGHGPRLATAIAAEETELFVVTPSQIEWRLERTDPIIRQMFRVLIDRYLALSAWHDEDDLVAAFAQIAAQPSEKTAAALGDVKLEREFAAGLDLGQLVLRYQPIVALKDGRIVGVEALVRWRHPQRGLIGPESFVALAEASGLILPMGAWVFETAAWAAARIRDLAGTPITMSVNLSPLEIEAEGSVDRLARIVASVGIDPALMQVEITETALAADPERLVERLEGCRAIGIGVALDDFGTGYSTLSHLHRFPIDVVKIDRSFVETLTESPVQKEIIRAVVRLSRRLAIRVVAEGIETEEQRAALLSLGCEYGQGFLFAEPMDEDAIVGRLAQPSAG